MFLEQRTTTATMPQVLVFKSNIRTPMEAWALCSALSTVPGVARCTVDLEDCDKVLRVQGDCLECRALVNIVNDWGVSIQELD